MKYGWKLKGTFLLQHRSVDTKDSDKKKKECTQKNSLRERGINT